MNLNNTYRPNNWQEVKGQEKIVNILRGQVVNPKTVSHAYIFAGKTGVGKTTLARLLIKALNCSHISKDGNPCGSCPSCINPSLSSLEVNASDTRGIDDMREIIQATQYLPSFKYLGVVLDEAHMLSKPAWNCILKPIEEAKEHVIWILCTTELGKVPKTIQSRCQVYKLSPLRYTDIFNRLKEIRNDIPDDSLWAIAKNSDNNLRRGINLLEQLLMVKDIKKVVFSEPIQDFLVALAKNSISDLWKVFTKGDEADDMESFLNALKSELSPIIKIHLSIPVDANPYKLQQYQDLAKQIPPQRALAMMEQLLAIEEKLFGVFDYNSLFLNALCNYKKNG